MLLAAQKSGYAIGAFNIENMEMAQAVVMAAEETATPVIVQTTPSTVKYASAGLFHAMVSSLAKASKIPIALHLDHGNSFGLAQQALETGYTSIMIDGSALSFEENIKLTSRVTTVSTRKQIPVEAELGKVGGKEDGMDGGAGNYTDPQMAKEFIKRTKITSLAVAIGTAHGIYSTKPILDIERLKKIRKIVDIPLVLHGASGLSQDQIRECIASGICKVNFATELRQAYKSGLDDFIKNNPHSYDPKTYGTASRNAVKELVIKMIEICKP